MLSLNDSIEKKNFQVKFFRYISCSFYQSLTLRRRDKFLWLYYHYGSPYIKIKKTFDIKHY